MLHDGRAAQLILVGGNSSFFDCYAQRVFIQMGLLKLIKYSTFEVSALNKIVGGYGVQMNISGADLTRFLYRFDWTNMT